MNRDAFLRALRRGLKGLPPHEINEIVEEYSAHFAESQTSGRQQTDVAAALGDPARIAREIKADAGLRRFEAQWSVSNMLAAVLGLAGLAIVDVLFLLPVLVIMIAVIVSVSFALLAIGAFGLKIIVTAVVFQSGGTLAAIAGHVFIGAGMVSSFIGGSALLLLCVGASIRLFGRYARLHFRLAKPVQHVI
ncbi:DUF1700 domain-containing protein [Agrobacterium rosae]